MTRLIMLLAVLAAFPPLSTDMYLPAIPLLQTLWNQPLAIINLTLVLFFAVYCICLLIYGPLSDRFGRRPPLIIGILIFMVGSFLCAASTGIEMLIAARIVQAAGAASAAAISMAIAKDRLEAREREAVMGYVSVIMALAPMVAPLIGSLMITRFTWPWIFVAQGMMGGVALVGVIFTPESHPASQDVPVKELVKSYGRILANGRFMSVVACTSLVGLPFFGFIAASSSIYISHYHLSENTFALFFGANALFFMAGAMVCARFGPRIGSVAMMSLGFAGLTAGGVVMALSIFTGPWALAVPMGLISFCLGISRPPANNLALEQVQEDAGAASSLLVFIYFMLGAGAMAVVSLDWENKVLFIGTLAIVTGSAASILWLLIKTRIRLPETS
ncbi:MAG: multidrug effflux MFS transporter [Desulfobacterium sp.]|nr:multidrug effflux MFS transporter [Desulfobacterium sp.]